MEPIFKPLTKEKKEELISRGYKEFEQPYCPKICDPDESLCKILYFIFLFILLLTNYIRYGNFSTYLCWFFIR